jgi:hypothetical protein
MVDRNHAVECNNCGSATMWAARVVGDHKERTLPEGWSLATNTIVGVAHFCSDDCERLWKDTRRDGWYKAPPSMVVP